MARKRLERKESEFDKIAAAWAIDLAKMAPEQQLFAKKAINDILFEGQMGTLHRDSVHINKVNRTSTPHSATSMESSPIITRIDYNYDAQHESMPQPSTSQSPFFYPFISQ